MPGEDGIPLPDVLDDTFRVDFYVGYVRAAQEAVAYDAVPLRGYFAWSLLGAPPPAAELACCSAETAGFLGPCAAVMVAFVQIAGCLSSYLLLSGTVQPAAGCMIPAAVEQERREFRHPWSFSCGPALHSTAVGSLLLRPTTSGTLSETDVLTGCSALRRRQLRVGRRLRQALWHRVRQLHHAAALHQAQRARAGQHVWHHLGAFPGAYARGGRTLVAATHTKRKGLCMYGVTKRAEWAVGRGACE